MLLTTGPSFRRCCVKTIAPAVAASSRTTTSAEIRTTDRLRSLTGRPASCVGSDSRAGRGADPGAARPLGLIVPEDDGHGIALGVRANLIAHRLRLLDPDDVAD